MTHAIELNLTNEWRGTMSPAEFKYSSFNLDT